MNTYFCYTRVSTVKQGDGVSLEAQKEAISLYAERHGLHISEWFEEKETAAKRGRPVFSGLVARLQNGEAKGVIIHKIDRSARNFSDWAMIGELIDTGVDIRFAHESLDMTTRGGRLTADIQAVIAADYVRNLREECVKGMNGRLKQGLYPFKAPIGYLDQGAGRPKIPDPLRAPYIRQAFELYATENYSIRDLLDLLRNKGFTVQTGKPMSKGCLEKLLKNPFYYGEIYIQRGNRRYRGVHEPIISKKLFDRVQVLKADRCHRKRVRHQHPFRRLVKCGTCGRSLCGEKQKGFVYMRCQTAGCPTNTIRADRLDAEIKRALSALKLSKADEDRLEGRLARLIASRSQHTDRRSLELQRSQMLARQEKLTDALIDGLITKEQFNERREALGQQIEEIDELISKTGQIAEDKENGRRFLELAKSLCLTYEMADPAQKGRIAKIAFLNLTLTRKKPCFEPHKWLIDREFAIDVLCGGPQRDTARTRDEIAAALEGLDL